MSFEVTNEIEDTWGTSLLEYFSANYDDLVKAFGEPLKSDCWKTTAQWVFESREAGEVYTLYDYKGDKWHIGGIKGSDIKSFRKWLRRKINEVNM